MSLVDLLREIDYSTLSYTEILPNRSLLKVELHNRTAKIESKPHRTRSGSISVPSTTEYATLINTGMIVKVSDFSSLISCPPSA
jgi:hypothetical protein